MKKNKIKLGLEILLMVVIFAMIYKLATDDTVQDKVQDSAVEQVMESGDLGETSLAATPIELEVQPQANDAKRVAKEIMEQVQSSPTRRGDFDSLN